MQSLNRIQFLDFPNEIYWNEIFPKLELSDLQNLEATSNSTRILVRNYIQDLGRSLGFHNIQCPKDLIENLSREISHNQIEFSTLIRFIINKILLLNQHTRQNINEILYQTNIELRNKKESFMIFEKEWLNLFDKINNKIILRPSTYLILQRNIPSMGLTFQNTDTRILDSLFPKWNEVLKDILRKKEISDSDIDEIRTEFNTKFYQMLY